MNITIKANENEIKRAYLKLAKEFHPDINKTPGAKEKFADISEAYNVLSEENKKKIYDNTGLGMDEQDDQIFAQGEDIETTQGHFHRNIIKENYNFFDENNEKTFNENEIILGKVDYGNTNVYEGVDNKGDIVVSVYLNFMESVEGCSKKIYFNRYEYLPENNLFKVKDFETKIQIPKGVHEQTILCLKNSGHEYFKAANSKGLLKTNVYIKIKLKPDNYFTRKNNDVYTTNYIPLSYAVLGGKIKIKTLKGQHELDILPNTKNDDTVVLKGFGILSGNHIVSLRIRLPSQLNDKTRDIFNKMIKL